MKPQSITQYDASHRFEPLLPADSVMGPLLERSSDLIRAATALGHTARPSVQLELRKLMRSMNSYYSNRIEGEHTRPSDIERALQQDFSAQADLARKQRAWLWPTSTPKRCAKPPLTAAAPKVKKPMPPLAGFTPLRH